MAGAKFFFPERLEQRFGAFSLRNIKKDGLFLQATKKFGLT